MNGLKIIRTRCNFTICEIANILGVSRQLVSSWENGRKIISNRRSKQLSEFFGVDECFFGEITEEQILLQEDRARKIRAENEGENFFLITRSR